MGDRNGNLSRASESVASPGRPETDALRLRRAVQEVAASPEFVRSGRMVRFLQYVAEQSVKEKLEVSERQIGIAVFDRAPDWDPKLDPIVRIEARRLREKLDKYYSAVTSDPEIILSMPKGSYRLEYEIRSPVPPAPLVPLDLPVNRTMSPRGRFRGAAFWAGGALVTLLAVVAFVLIRQSKAQVIEDRPIQIAAFKLSNDAEKLGTGPALAGMLADQIRNLQANTRTTWAAAPVEDVWTDETPVPFFTRITRKLDQIALSDDNFRKLPVRISGFIKQIDTADIELYLRGGGIAPRSFVGQSNKLADVLGKAAEYVYAECQPSAFSVYLDEHGRYAEAIRFSQQRYARATHSADKSQLLFSWAMALNSQGDPPGAAEAFRAVIDVNPQSWGSYAALIVTYLAMGQAEQALQTGELLERQAHRGSWLYAHLPSALFRPVRTDTFIPVDQLRRDALSLKHSLESELAATAGAGIHEESIVPFYAETLIQLHEWRQARIELQVAKTMSSSDPADILELSIDLAQQSGNLGELKALLATNRETLTDPQRRAKMRILEEDLCSIAVAYNQVGDRATADLLVEGRRASMGCLESRAEILSERGDRSAAKSMFLQSIAKGPRLPLPHYRFGLLLIAQGKTDEARCELELARKYGPHWAEPAKALAELDLRLGNTSKAVEEFETASRYAPKWSELYSGWAAALLKTGHRDDGQDKLRMARSFGESAAE